jgi:hypothetical protein
MHLQRRLSVHATIAYDLDTRKWAVAFFSPVANPPHHSQEKSLPPGANRGQAMNLVTPKPVAALPSSHRHNITPSKIGVVSR